jgi:hypothetical protein
VSIKSSELIVPLQVLCCKDTALATLLFKQVFHTVLEAAAAATTMGGGTGTLLASQSLSQSLSTLVENNNTYASSTTGSKDAVLRRLTNDVISLLQAHTASATSSETAQESQHSTTAGSLSSSFVGSLFGVCVNMPLLLSQLPPQLVAECGLKTFTFHIAIIILEQIILYITNHASNSTNAGMCGDSCLAPW